MILSHFQAGQNFRTQAKKPETTSKVFGFYAGGNHFEFHFDTTNSHRNFLSLTVTMQWARVIQSV
jgi:hypothetical protein